MTADTDRDLAHRCLAGEEGAWRRLTTRYADVVYGVAWRCGLRGDDAGDVVQETFLALWKSLGRMQKKERLLAWILRTARREAWRQVRRARAVHRREGRVARPELAEEALPEEALEELERQQVVRQAFAGLGAKCRRLLDALFFEAEVRPYEEIAVELDMAVGLDRTHPPPLSGVAQAAPRGRGVRSGGRIRSGRDRLQGGEEEAPMSPSEQHHPERGPDALERALAAAAGRAATGAPPPRDERPTPRAPGRPDRAREAPSCPRPVLRRAQALFGERGAARVLRLVFDSWRDAAPAMRGGGRARTCATRTTSTRSIYASRAPRPATCCCRSRRSPPGTGAHRAGLPRGGEARAEDPARRQRRRADPAAASRPRGGHPHPHRERVIMQAAEVPLE